MGLFSVLRSLYSIFCGPEQPQPAPQQAQEYKPSAPSAQHAPSAPAYKPLPARRASPGAPQHEEPVAQQLHQRNYYDSLRARAVDEGAKMAQCFEESHAAYAAHEGARAKELSEQGRAHQREMDRLNGKASEWIFSENNKDRRPDEVDLHGLYVKEAISFTERAINEARAQGTAKVHLIVGKGLHSPRGVAKLKPAIEELMQKQGLVVQLDEKNAGVLIVSLDGQLSGAGSVVQPDDITRQLEKDGGCLIM